MAKFLIRLPLTMMSDFGDVGVGALVDNVQGTGFYSMVVTVEGFNPADFSGPDHLFAVCC